MLDETASGRSSGGDGVFGPWLDGMLDDQPVKRIDSEPPACYCHAPPHRGPISQRNR